MNTRDEGTEVVGAAPAETARAAGQDEAGPVVGKLGRPRTFDRDDGRYQWHFGAVPKYIREDGVSVPSPFRKVAVYVVHGIGEQALSETAATLRVGLEDAVTRGDPGHWDPEGDDCWIVPEPYIYDGYWADYADFETTVPEVFEQLGEVPRRYFEQVWQRRTQSAGAAFSWLIRTGVELISKSIRARKPSALYYVGLIPMLWIVTAIMLVRSKTRGILEHFVGDVPLYVAPTGDVQSDIVQRIDRRVAIAYLRLLGLDENLDELPREQWLTVSGEHHRFDQVVWVSHSLGTVISYNVIGDLLHQAKRKREDAEGGEHSGATRLEQSLRSLVTLGSPLDKIAYLFGEKDEAKRIWPALRPWPAEYLKDAKGGRSLWDQPGFHWANFFYAADPVSGRLDEFKTAEGVSLVENIHPKGRHIPAVAHIDYWKDPTVLCRILELTYGRHVVAHPVETLSPPDIKARAVGASILTLALLAGGIAGVFYMAYLRFFGGG